MKIREKVRIVFAAGFEIHGSKEVEASDKDIQEVLKMEEFVGADRYGVGCDEVDAALLILLAVDKH